MKNFLHYILLFFRRKVTVTSGILSKYSSLLTSIHNFSQEGNKKDILNTSHRRDRKDENTFHSLGYEEYLSPYCFSHILLLNSFIRFRV